MPIWNKEAECGALEARRQAQLEELQKTVERVYSRVPFYRNKLDEKGVKPDDIRCLKDIAKLPFTTKYELRETYPYGLLACAREDLVETGAVGKMRLRRLAPTAEQLIDGKQFQLGQAGAFGGFSVTRPVIVLGGDLLTL